MMKCTVCQARPEDLGNLVSLKLTCTHENYRGFFDYAPLNDQNSDDVRNFFVQMMNTPDTQVTIMSSQTKQVGYAVSRRLETKPGSYACEMTAIDVIPDVSTEDYHLLITSAVEAAAGDGISVAYVYLLNNNYRGRFAFEHVGFRNDGIVVKKDINGEQFNLIRYIYCFSKPCLCQSMDLSSVCDMMDAQAVCWPL